MKTAAEKKSYLFTVISLPFAGKMSLWGRINPWAKLQWKILSP